MASYLIFFIGEAEGGGAQVAKSRLIGLRDWRSVEHVLLSRKGQT